MRSLLNPAMRGAFNRRHHRVGHLFQNRYPWTGHSALLGTVPRPWQETATILAQYGPSRRRARHAYRTFVAEGIPQGRRPELQGGGLVRSAGGWAAVTALRRGREAYGGDERILGGTAYLWCRVGGQVGRELAAAIGLSHQAVSQAAARGEQAAARWKAVWYRLR